MGRINVSRVLLGGVVAGLVINLGEFLLNGVILAEASREAMAAIGMEETPGAMVVYLLMGFILGILAVYLYAAIRPRFGAGPKTAVMAGVLIWAIFYALCTMNFMAAGLWPRNLLLIGLVWGLGEAVIATVAGAKFYTEPAA